MSFTFTSPPPSLHFPLLPCTAHEAALEEACWISSGTKSLFVTPNGGDFPLVPVGREEDAKQMIQLCVPSGAVRADGEGVEIRYAVIPDGPFQIPEGYKLCSTAVYIKYSQAQTTKPFLLSLPHWSGAADHPVFVTSPHTLPEGEQYYQFRLLEGGEFSEGYGIVEVDGHCSLFALAYRLEDTSRYYASLWERKKGNILHKWQETQGDHCTWKDLLEAMTFAGIAEQHCSQLVQELHQWMQGEEVPLGLEPSCAQC